MHIYLSASAGLAYGLAGESDARPRWIITAAGDNKPVVLFKVTFPPKNPQYNIASEPVLHFIHLHCFGVSFGSISSLWSSEGQTIHLEKLKNSVSFQESWHGYSRAVPRHCFCYTEQHCISSGFFVRQHPRVDSHYLLHNDTERKMRFIHLRRLKATLVITDTSHLSGPHSNYELVTS